MKPVMRSEKNGIPAETKELRQEIVVKETNEENEPNIMKRRTNEGR